MDETAINAQNKESIVIANPETSIKEGQIIPTTNSNEINKNKPWRHVIRRNVIDGGNNNESEILTNPNNQTV